MGNKLKTSKSSEALSQDRIGSSLTSNPSSSATKVNLPNGVSILWLDSNAFDDTKDSHKTRTMLEQFHLSVFIYDDVDKCFTFLNSISNKLAKMFIIVSGRFSTSIISKIQNFPLIDSVFIFCCHRQAYEHLIHTHKPHVIGVFIEHNELEKSVRDELEAFQNRQSGINFFAQKQNTTRDLTYDAASFLWFQLFCSTLVKGHYDNQDKQLMLDYCRHHYARDSMRDTFYAQIDTFEKEYESKNAIAWYTKEIFLYKLVNAALRTEDIDALYIFRFFISDLSRELAAQHKSFREQSKESPIITLYRGCTMPKEEVEKLAALIGGVTSLNGFISASYKREIAERFMHQSYRLSDVRKVLFTIKADTELDKPVFASIGPLSDFSDEEEILFDIGSSFLIDEVTVDRTAQVWHIQVTATDFGTRAAADYVALIEKESVHTSITVIFGQLLIEMGKYQTAQKYFLELLKRSTKSENQDLGDIHYNLGLIYTFQKELSDAERHLQQAYEYQKLVKLKERNLVRARNALGWVYQDNGELEPAMEFYKEAEHLGKSLLGSDHLTNAQTFANMGSCHVERMQFQDGRICYNEALRIMKLHLPDEHPRIAVVLNDLGNVCRRQIDSMRIKNRGANLSKEDDSSEAFSFYHAAEKIFLGTLPTHHPHTAYCWSCLGMLYLREDRIDQAQHYHKKALNSYRFLLPADHINIQISEQNSKCVNYQRINDSYIRICSS